MQTSTPAFASAVVAPDQITAFKILIGFPGSVPSSYQDVTRCVQSIQLDRAITTNLPDGTTLVTGYPAASAQLVLSGMLNQSVLNENQTIYWLMNPNDPTSPLYRTTRAGLTITIQLGLYVGNAAPEMFTVFTGTIDISQCLNGSVVLSCRDNRSTVTNQATLPPVITPTPFNSGLTSEFAIDYMLRHASPSQYNSWPAQRPNCIFAAGMRSSVWPEIGAFTSSTNTPAFQQGRYGSAVTQQATTVYYTMSQPIVPSNTSFFLEYYAGIGSEVFVTDAGHTYFVVIAYENDGNIHFFTSSPSGTTTQTFAVTPGTIPYVGAQVNWAAGSASVTGTLYLEQTSHALALTAKDVRPTNLNLNTAGVFSGVTGSVEAFQVSLESAGVSNGSFSPTLLLDQSLNPLVALPDVTGNDVWTVLQQIAAAENGVIGFNEQGQVYFSNRDTLATETSQRQITSTKSLLSLTSSEQMSLCATHIQIPVNQLQIGAFTTVWSASTVIQISPGSTWSAVITTNNPIVALGTSIEIIPNGGVLAPGFSGYRAARTVAGVTAVTNLQMTVEQLAPSAVSVSIFNPNPYTVYITTPSASGYPPTSVGQPALDIGAMPVTASGTATDLTTSTSSGTYADAQWPPLIPDGGAINNPQFGEVLLQLPENDWMQDLPTAEILATDLLSTLFVPVPLITGVAIIPDPRLQLGEVDTLIDTDISQTNADVSLIGIHFTISAGSDGSFAWTESIDTQVRYRPGMWVLGVQGKSELGVTTYIA